MSTRQALRTAAAKNPPPKTTAATVPKGQSSRMAKGRRAAAKVAANKAAVARLNKAAENKGTRIAFATREKRALEQWQANGSKGDRPPTPNYDAVLAAREPKETTEMATAKKTAKKATRTTGEHDPKTDAKAYDMRVNRGLSFSDVADKLGYDTPRAARMGVARHARTNSLPDPFNRRSETAAARYAERAGLKTAKKVAAVAKKAAPAKKATAKKSSRKAGAVGKQSRSRKAA